MKEDAPTNSMSGVYATNAPGFRVGKKDRQKRIYPDIDGNFTDGIPGNSGDPFYLRPEGYWNGGSDWTEDQVPDASQDYLAGDPTGKSTNDLIAEDGTVKTFLPPDSRSFILGPLVDGYVRNHGYDNYTNIGYIQKDTRQFVLLARIQGQFTADLHDEGARVWDGTSGQLTVYNSNFTLAMAEWFRDQITAGTSTSNVPYFYSGGVPQQELNVLQCPSCPPNMFGGVTPGTRAGGGFGTGTPPTLGSLQEPPQSGDQVKIKYFNITPSQAVTIAALLTLGLSVAAILAVLFPEPTSSAAGAAYLASKWRFAAGLKRAFANIFKTKPKYTPSKVRYPRKSAEERALDDLLKRLEQPPAIPKNPNPRLNPKKRFPVGDSYDHITDVNQKLIFELFEKELLNEVAPTETSPSGGTEVADVYVDKMQKDYDADQLQQASDDANDIAKEGGKGISDAELAKIDRAAEESARKMANLIRIGNPEGMNREQLFKAIELIHEQDDELFWKLTDMYEDLIDESAIEPALEEYKTQKEYLYTEEYNRTFPDYVEYKDAADAMWPYVSKLTFRWRVPIDDETGKGFANIAYYNGVQVDTWDAGFGALRKWGEAHQAHYDVYNNVIIPARELELSLAFEKYATVVDVAYRQNYIAVIRAWNMLQNMEGQGDPYALDEPIPHDLAGNLAMLGISYVAAVAMIKALGVARVAALSKTKNTLNSIKNWWNKGRNVRVPGEDTASFKDLRIDDKLQGSKFVKKGSRWKDPKDLTNADFEGGAIPRNLDQVKQLLQGKGGFTWSLSRGWGTGPTALTRQLVERPFRTIMKFFEDYELNGKLLTEESSDQKELYDALDAALKETDPKDFGKVIDTFINMISNEENKRKKMGKESYKPKFRRNRETLTETRTHKQKKILREIKQPIKLKETPTKYKMNFSGKYSSQNTPDKTASHTTDELVSRANAKGQQWRESDKYWSGYETTERMNVIHDRVGHGSQYWDRMLDEAREKNNWRTREVQEELNKIAHEKAMLKENPDYRSPFGDGVEIEDTTTKNVQNFERVTKIKKVVADTKVFNNKEIKPEYPDDEDKQKEMMSKMAKKMGPEMEKMKKEYEHEKLQSGERASAYYKRLDPISAKSMPDSGYPQIDDLRDQAKKKPK